MTAMVEERGRITARVSLTLQAKLQAAADLSGATLNQFVVQSALEKAKQILDRETIITFSRKDAAMMIDLLDNPQPPNEALMRARARYQRRSTQDGDHHHPAGQKP